MKYVFMDFETFYSSDYTLRKQDPASYILDPRFSAHCIAVAEGFEEPPYLVEADGIPDMLARIGTDVAVVTHNALFDACILNWRYGYVPRLLVDTLAMCRTLLHWQLKSLALRNVANFLGFGIEKTTVAKAEGMGVADLKANGMWEGYIKDCMDDTHLCRMIFRTLMQKLPLEEYVFHDMIIRCAVEPVFKADLGLLAQNIAEVGHRKDILFFKAMCAGLTDKGELMSNVEFADLLKSLDVQPPQKISKTTGKMTWAFAKSDPDFLALLEHDDPRVVALVEARLAFKTTIEETRSQRMLDIASLTVPGKGTGWMPIPLKIGGAHTHRLSGDWKVNPQNWGRKSLIRKAILAPDGHKVVTADSAQIEARMNAWFCGQWDLVEDFRNGVDVYAKFAQDDIYHVPVDKNTEPAKRFVGKVGILQLGYQSGPQKLMDTIWIMSYNSEDEPIQLSYAQSQDIVFAYRHRFDRINGMWGTLADEIPRMARLPSEVTVPIGTNDVIKIGFQHMEGPNGLVMHYDKMQYDYTTRNWTYEYAGVRYKLYGGKWLENIIQFLARICTMQAAIRLRPILKPYGVRLNHTSHDELIYVVLDECVEEVKFLLREEMCRAPEWAPDLPLACDVGVGQSYGEAK